MTIKSLLIKVLKSLTLNLLYKSKTREYPYLKASTNSRNSAYGMAVQLSAKVAPAEREKVIKKYRNNKIFTHEHTPFFLILSLKPREPFLNYQLQEQFCYSQPNKLGQY